MARSFFFFCTVKPFFLFHCAGYPFLTRPGPSRAEIIFFLIRRNTFRSQCLFFRWCFPLPDLTDGPLSPPPASWRIIFLIDSPPFREPPWVALSRGAERGRRFPPWGKACPCSFCCSWCLRHLSMFFVGVLSPTDVLALNSFYASRSSPSFFFSWGFFHEGADYFPSAEAVLPSPDMCVQRFLSLLLKFFPLQGDSGPPCSKDTFSFSLLGIFGYHSPRP